MDTPSPGQDPSSNKDQAAKAFVRPYFIPEGIGLEELPSGLQLAITALIEPLYRELVLGAQSGLEQSLGATHVFLTCIELIDQISLASKELDTNKPGDNDERRLALESHFRLVSAKHKSASGLLRMAELRRRNSPQFG